MSQDRWQTLLEQLHERAPILTFEKEQRLVIVSDLHMGAGKRHDDFSANGPMLLDLLERYYLPKNYFLVLNGDVEELWRNKREEVLAAWPRAQEIFQKFIERNRYARLEGNHDPAAWLGRQDPPVRESLRICRPEGELFLLHGHQVDPSNAGDWHQVLATLLKVFANPFGIRNSTRRWDDTKALALEDRVYRYALKKGLAAVIGHTHRPLFESRSKVTDLEMLLEQACRLWVRSSRERRLGLEKRIAVLRQDLRDHFSRGIRDLPSSIYTKEILVPCLFNSGCVIGKRGLTLLEGGRRKFRLVHWRDPSLHPTGLVPWEHQKQQVWQRGRIRTILREERWDRLFARIHLLGKNSLDFPIERV